MNKDLKYWRIALMALFAVLLVACANIGTPDGGPYDETPPRLLHTTPRFGATKSNSTRIVLEFDENVKITNASEKVIVSPPQIEQPEIDAPGGKRITIKLKDSLKLGTTYTIDFSDAIEDANEGNPMGDYAFTFSTGQSIDTMQVSGYVLDASNLEPIKGIAVGLYEVGEDEQLHDSVFKTKPFERISRTDSRGHFIVKGMAAGKKYRVFALNDQDQTYTYSQKSEMIGWSPVAVTSSCKPDVKADTVWHDSIHYDSIVMRPYTHFYPDDIVITAFQSAKQDRFLLKRERPEPHFFNLYFTAGDTLLPEVRGLNFDSDSAFAIDYSTHKDTLTYWIKDTLVSNIDTLEMELRFYATDTTGALTLTTDTVMLVSKLTKERIAKRKADAYNEWVKEAKKEWKNEQKRKALEGGVKASDDEFVPPPMPEELLDIKTNNTTLNPDQNIKLTLPEPPDSIDMTKIHLQHKEDSVYVDQEFVMKPIEGRIMEYMIYGEWIPDSTYQLLCDSGAFISIYGRCTKQLKKSVKIKGLESFSTLFLTITGVEGPQLVQLLDGSDKVIKTVATSDGKADFYFVDPGTYYLRTICDTNNNGKWDPGSYEEGQQAEEVYYNSGFFELRAQWEIKQNWAPKDKPLYLQKPEKITKQKPDKEKDIKARNKQREQDMLARKRGG